MLKEALEAAIKSDNVWAGRSTLVLAIGILGEYALLPFLEKRAWHKPAKIVFAVLVVAGIVGEFEFSSRIAQHADDLQRLSDKELSGAMIKAASADERAGKAIKDAADANERASKNEKAAAQLRMLAEDGRVARVKIEKALRRPQP